FLRGKPISVSGHSLTRHVYFIIYVHGRSVLLHSDRCWRQWPAVPGSRALNTQSLFPPSLPNDWKIARIGKNIWPPRSLRSPTKQARAYRAVLRSHQSTCLLCAPSINEAIGLLMNSVFISLCLAL
ncbi:unnamed protein product, partial [Mycena citricolor]